ncbi:MAG: hypothetical protein QGI45_01315, partial [Myxococcota bacterium]|nr:hypothetical protein [Myxococcota bacterium]
MPELKNNRLKIILSVVLIALGAIALSLGVPAEGCGGDLEFESQNNPLKEGVRGGASTGATCAPCVVASNSDWELFVDNSDADKSLPKCNKNQSGARMLPCGLILKDSLGAGDESLDEFPVNLYITGPIPEDTTALSVHGTQLNTDNFKTVTKKIKVVAGGILIKENDSLLSMDGDAFSKLGYGSGNGQFDVGIESNANLSTIALQVDYSRYQWADRFEISDNGALREVSLQMQGGESVEKLRHLTLTGNDKLSTVNFPNLKGSMNKLQIDNNGSTGFELSHFDLGSAEDGLSVSQNVSVNGNTWAFGGEGQDEELNLDAIKEVTGNLSMKDNTGLDGFSFAELTKVGAELRLEGNKTSQVTQLLLFAPDSSDDECQSVRFPALLDENAVGTLIIMENINDDGNGGIPECHA